MAAESASVAPPQASLVDEVRDKSGLKRYSIRNERARVASVRRSAHFHGLHHPEMLGAQEREAVLTYLAVEGNVAAAIWNLSKCALLFVR